MRDLFESRPSRARGLKLTEPKIPWRELAGFRNVIVHGYLGADRGAVWLVVERDLPALGEAVHRMAGQLGPLG